MKRASWRLPMLIAGWALVIAAPIAGLLPGPGGIFLFAGGITLLLRTSPAMRRCYVAVARRWPRLGGLLDRALRRPRAGRTGRPRP